MQTEGFRISAAERAARLDQQIAAYSRQGYRVQSRTETSVQLVRPKQFNLVAALLWFFCFGVGVLVYVAYYLSKSDDVLYFGITDEGELYSD